MTREELLRILERFTMHADYFCDEGRHRGKMRMRVTEPYLTPDELAAIQKDIYELNESLPRPIDYFRSRGG
jgi:hypothetical protein